MKNQRPNVVLVMTDQHCADYLGCVGKVPVRTPNLDALAATGVRFDRFYASSPVCMPNRATLMTGRMPSAHGARHNGLPLPVSANTFVELMREAGYSTALVGKSHLQNMFETPPALVRPPPRPDRQRIDSETYDSALKPDATGDYKQELPSRWRSESDVVTFPFYGFDEAKLCTNHGDQVGGAYWQWLKTLGHDPDTLAGAKNALPHEAVCPQAWRTAVPEELYPTRYIEQESIAFLDKHASSDSESPFFLMTSFTDPHHPFTPPGKYWDMYDPDDFEVPLSFYPGENEPPHVRHCREQRASGQANLNSFMAIGITEQEAKEAMALTCGMLTMIDDAIGAIVSRLKALQLDQNTIVIFTSDHGDLLGDHGMLLKGPMHYQSLIRVPFIWSDPRPSQQGGTVQDPLVTEALASTIDLPASILEVAGIEPFFGMHGRSLLPALAGSAEVNESVMIEEDQQRKVFGFDTSPRCRTLVTQGHRLTTYLGVDWGELYDLEQDPFERNNLWDDPGTRTIRNAMFESLCQQMMGAVDWSPLPTSSA